MDAGWCSCSPRLISAYRFSPTFFSRTLGVLILVILFGFLLTQVDNRRIRRSRSAWGDLDDSEFDYLSTEQPGTKEFEVFTTEDGAPRKLLTLFTSFKPSKERNNIYKTIVRNWGKLGSSVQPVLYATPGDEPLSEYAVQHGWHVHPVPRSNRFRTPFLKNMYLHAEAHYQSDFYAYANGDLLFDKGLVDTLTDLQYALPNNKTMVVGRRTNYVLKDVNKELEGTTIKDFTIAQDDLALSVNLFKALAIDYFISNRGGIDWQKLPDFVIGRAGYDNYLIHFAKKHAKAIVVDASRTIRALHLQGAKFQLTHRTANDSDSKFNLKIIRRLHEFKGPKPLIDNGNVNVAQLESRHKGDGIEFVPHQKKLTSKADTTAPLKLLL